MVCGGPNKNRPLIYRMTLVNMGKQNKQGYTGYTETLELTWVHRIYIGVYRVYSITTVNVYTRYIGVYRVYSITRVNMGTQDVYWYTGYTI